jgi:putative PIN family toxin of toxin-antitoxin system
VRITLDSNILVRAVVRPHGPALRLFDLVLRDHVLVLSRFILDEVERVLLYPRIQSRYRITALEAAALAERLAEIAFLVEPVIACSLILSDPADDPVLYTAAAGKAEILATLNIRHFSAIHVQ